MTDQLPAVFQSGQLPARFQGVQIDNSALSAGITGGYGVVSIKGRVFRVKHQGTEHPYVDENGDAVPSIEVVLVAANPNITKQFYSSGYEEGSNAAPDCYSLDGKTPAEEAPAKQHHNCATCPMNQFGSRISEQGKKAKACSDTRRLAIVPVNDLRNEAFGGPMLFRVPPSALRGLSMYADLLKSRGYPFYAVATRIGFDNSVSHPLPTFKAIRPLTNDEAEVVAELMAADTTQRVLADFSAGPADAPAQAAAKEDEVFEQPPAAPAPAPVAKPAAPAPAVAPKPTVAAPRPVVAPVARPAPAPAPAAVKPAAPAPATKPATPRPAAPRPVVQAAAPAPAPAQAATPAEAGGDLEDDIREILAGLAAAGTEPTAA